MTKCQYLYLVGGFKREFYVPCHTWDVINVILTIDFHSIIFQYGHIAPPTRYEKPWHETKKRSLEETAYFFRQPFLRRERIGCFVTHILWWSLVQKMRHSRNSPEVGYKWRFLAGEIIHFYGPSIPWQTVNVITSGYIPSHRMTNDSMIPSSHHFPRKIRRGQRRVLAFLWFFSVHGLRLCHGNRWRTQDPSYIICIIMVNDGD